MVNKIIFIILLSLIFSGCSMLDFMDCGDRGVCRRTGFLWHRAICEGDKECK